MSVIDLNETPTAATTAKTTSVAATPAPIVAVVTETKEQVAGRYAFAVVRLGIGFTFLWAFVDKLFGFGYATASGKSWLNGGSPTTGFLKGVHGPLAGVFNPMAGNTFVDWLFMVSLLAIGAAVMLGVGMRIAAASGALLLVFMWAASLPIVTNPFLDEHLIYAVVLIGLALIHAGNTVGFGKIWSHVPFVKAHPVLV